MTALGRVFKAPAVPVFLVLALALGLRVYCLDVPFVEPYNNISRQAIGGSIARNYYRHGFNLLYPEIDENGTGSALFNAELPIYAYLMAFGYKLAGGVEEWVARLVPVLFSMLFLVCLYDLIRRLSTPKIAWIGLAFASLSPMGLAMSRSIQPDMMMLALGTASAYFFYRSRTENNPIFHWLSALFFGMALLVKIYAVHFLLPIVYLAWSERGRKIFSERALWFYPVFAVPALVWYGIMLNLGTEQGLFYEPYEMLSQYAHGQVKFSELFGAAALLQLAKIFVIHLLSPLGFLLLLGNLKKGRPYDGTRFFLAWLFAVAFYLLLALPKTERNSYYQLTFLPPLAFFVATGCQRIAESGFWKRRWAAAALIACLAIGQTYSLWYFYEKLYFIPEKFQNIVRAGAVVDSRVPKDAIVLASYGTSPTLLYHCDRRGWMFAVEGQDAALIEQLETYRRKGADYFVTSQPGSLRAAAEFEKHLRSRYPVLAEDDGLVLFRLAVDA